MSVLQHLDRGGTTSPDHVLSNAIGPIYSLLQGKNNQEIAFYLPVSSSLFQILSVNKMNDKSLAMTRKNIQVQECIDL